MHRFPMQGIKVHKESRTLPKIKTNTQKNFQELNLKKGELRIVQRIQNNLQQFSETLFSKNNRQLNKIRKIKHEQN